MYKDCQREQSAQRQAHIARAFVHLLETRDFPDITVTELCREAGIPRKAFYRYFDAKEDIIRYLADAFVRRYINIELSTQREDRGHEMPCQKLFAFWYDYRDQLRALVRSDCLGIFSECLTRGVLEREPEFDTESQAGSDQALTSLFATAGFISLLVYWAHTDFRDTPEEMGRTLYRLLTQPIYA